MRTALAKTCPDCRLAVLVIHADRTRLVSQPWSGRLAHSDKTAHYTVLVIHADRTRPISQPWCGRPARTVTIG